MHGARKPEMSHKTPHPMDGLVGMLPPMSTLFFLKLIPPRPTFARDMNAEERALMQQHVEYTRAHFEAGKVLVYGSVMAARKDRLAWPSWTWPTKPRHAHSWRTIHL
jgi:hypothetical protein